MTMAALEPTTDQDIAAVLGTELAQGDFVLATIAPVLGHLLANHDNSLFSDEVVARVQGMVQNVANQILVVHGSNVGAADPRQFAVERETRLAGEIAADQALLLHCHALAIESQLTQRLHESGALDPVLSPLLQSLVASDDAQVAESAMGLLAAQARFVETQRRMELPLRELTGELFHKALVAFVETFGPEDGAAVERSVDALRAGFDEGASRIGLLARIVTGMGAGARAALAIHHAGTALFLTALALATGQDRPLAVLATNDRQLARLALMLRAAGLQPQEVEEQFLYLHPDIALPDGFETLRADQAGAMLAASCGFGGS